MEDINLVKFMPMSALKFGIFWILTFCNVILPWMNAYNYVKYSLLTYERTWFAGIHMNTLEYHKHVMSQIT